MTTPSPTQKRERAILDAARKLLREDGSWGLRISAIAKSVGVSVGTFYSHFASKEDLILALYHMAAVERLKKYEHTFALKDLPHGDRLIVSAFRNFVFTLDHPDYYSAERLSTSLAVWESADSNSRARILTIHETIDTAYRAQAQRAIDAGDFSMPEHIANPAGNLNSGAWMVMLGCSYVNRMRTMVLKDRHPERAIPATILSTVEAFFVGSGWNSSNPTEDIARLAEQALALDAPEPSESPS